LSLDLITPFGHGAAHGNFLSFRVPHAAAIERALAAVDVYADHRGDRMRFGFGLEITIEDVDAAIERMAEVLARSDPLESHRTSPPNVAYDMNAVIST
jgi:kynureninase